MTKTLLNNRYQVIQVLSAGGFGETFLAEDTYMPSRRRCVIKQLKPITNDPQTYKMIQQRFEREAATLEYLGEASDQIPKLYAYFSENGQFYLVQEWIHGPTLTEIVKSKGPQNETSVREILLSLLSVLDYVHSKGIIHRDIKPDNILLGNASASSTSPYQVGVVGSKPVLIDFGAVKETIRSVVNSPGYHTKSLVIGTPGYMPSEQGVGRPVYASDIYSLGLTAIYLLTGKHPHELQTDPQTGEILWQHQASGVSPNLVMVLNQAIKPHASDRYTTASKMLYALQSAASIPHTPTAATQPTIALSPVAGQSPQQIQPLSSDTYNPVISASSTPRNWQKPIWIVGSLVAGGLIGAVAIASLNRQPVSEAPIATSPSPTPFSESNTTNPVPSPQSPTPTFRPTKKPIAILPILPPPTPIASERPQQPVTPAPSRTPVVSAPELEKEPVDSDPPTLPAASLPPSQPDNITPSAIPTPESPPALQKNNALPSPKSSPPLEKNNALPSPESSPAPQKNNAPRDNSSLTTNIQSVPAFPTGTPKSVVEDTLGSAKDLRGAWPNTRAVTYHFVPNKIDLGYLFDRKSGELRQTEVSFAQSVDPQVMQTTLEEMLGGEATEKIKQGLQNVQKRQLDNFRFQKGSLKGQIVRQECDFIYISVWNKDLHDYGSPSQDRKC